MQICFQLVGGPPGFGIGLWAVLTKSFLVLYCGPHSPTFGVYKSTQKALAACRCCKDGSGVCILPSKPAGLAECKEEGVSLGPCICPCPSAERAREKLYWGRQGGADLHGDL